MNINKYPAIAGGVAIGGSLLAALGYRKYRSNLSKQRREQVEAEIKQNYKNYLQNRLNYASSSS